MAPGEPLPVDPPLKVATIMSAQVAEVKVMEAVTLLCVVETTSSSAAATGPVQPLGIGCSSMV